MISQFKSPRVDIVFDQYFTPSIKDYKRLRRNETTSTVSIGRNQIRHHNFAELDDNFEKKCRSFDSSSLPPYKAELYQHLLRVRYVTKFWINAHLKNPSSLSPIASGWIVNDDKYDFVWFALEQFPSSAADIVIKKPTLLENQNIKQDDDYDDIDNNGSSDNDEDHEDASVF
ncbi:uncharacterized protein TNCV_2144671 [Trichonephila clavipes]|nr:uncharacterized protein TNCV_2144671 [Trichonephila clavipes]